MRLLSSIRLCLPQNLMETLTLISAPFLFRMPSLNRRTSFRLKSHVSTSAIKSIPIGDEALMGFISGNMRVTEVVHSVWRNIIQKGDTVVDATCGNGYDTLALLKMVADEVEKGCVYGMDIQSTALESTASLVEQSADPNEKKLVKLSLICHSKMEEVIPRDTPVRLVAFNLGYLPGGDKAIITRSHTTFMALQAACRMVKSGGLISIVVYVGHAGGRDEMHTVQSFASSLPMESWVSCKLEVLNRPTCPVLVFLFKK